MASSNALKDLTNLKNAKTEEKCKCKKDSKSMCNKNCTSNAVPTRSDPKNATSRITKENTPLPTKVNPVSSTTLLKRKLLNVDDNKENVQKGATATRQSHRGLQAQDSKRGYVTAPFSVAGPSTSNIHVRKPIMITNEKDVFIDGERENLLKNTPIKTKQNIRFGDVSPIIPNSKSLCLINCEGPITSDYLTQYPAEEEKRLVKREEYYRHEKFAAYKQPFSCDVHNSEYIDDIIPYLMETEHEFWIEDKEFLKKHNPNEEFRLIVVNWLFQVQREYGEDTTTVLRTTYLFDNVLSALPVPDVMYKLVITTLFWLVNKLHKERDHKIRVEDLVEMCNKSYSKDQFIAMELKLLKFFNFTLNVHEPFSYLCYYHGKINLQRSVLLVAKYMIEAFSLSKYFSTIKPSELATAVLVLVCEMEHPKLLTTLSTHLKYDITSLAAIKTCIVQHMRSMRKKMYLHSQANKKYLTEIDREYPDFFINLWYVG